MKQVVSIIILVLLDVFAIVISIMLAYELRVSFNGVFFSDINHNVSHYLGFLLLYIIPIMMFTYESIYTQRRDFWQESYNVVRVLLISLVLIFAIMALEKDVASFSRFILVISIVFMMFFIPLGKNIGKKLLYKYGLWQKKARIYGCDVLIRKEIFKNPYLGYIYAGEDSVDVVLINAKDMNLDERDKIISEALSAKHEVLFIPTFDEFDLTSSHIDKLQNTRTNIVYFQNRLASTVRVMLQVCFNYALAFFLVPILLPVIGILAFIIKKESSGPAFFTHNRVGKDGQIIATLKFRSMYSDASERLEKLLAEDAKIKAEWEKNFKLKEDPRVTKVGSFLRKTSLDELPQIFNVLKGEMNFVGPRPVIQQEIDKYYKEDAKYYFMVKPGITGLWQVSGRSNTNYKYRVKTDKWYVMNWSLWLDIVILLKTVKVVFLREGAY